MALQDRSALVLEALSILGDAPPHPKQPQLGNGVHLRYSPGPARGFPAGGYYVFRRPPSETSCLVSTLQTATSLADGAEVWTGLGTFAVASGNFTLLPAVPPKTTFFGGFAMGGRMHTLTFSPRWTTSYVTMSLNIHPGGTVTVVGTLTTPSGTTTVFSQTKSGAPVSPSASVVNWSMVGSGKIDKITITSTATDLIELCAMPVAASSASAAARHSALPEAASPGTGWGAIANLPTPITLPLVHPNYAASAGAESIVTASARATGRFHYGLWADSFASASRTAGPGTITLTNGSAVATGSGTNWTAGLAGKMICVPAGGADYSAYAVMSVLAPDRVILSRAFSGATASGAAYELLAGDDFAEFHDRVACLVQSTTGMRSATSPPALDAGTLASGRFVQISASSPTTVQGIGTAWTAALAGASIEVGPAHAGSAYFSGTTVYGIQSVQSPTQLTLDRPFAGPTSTGQVKADFRITGATSAAADASGPAVDFRPMDLLELACLLPGYAQALGLYCIDADVVSGRVYDYIVLADHANRFGLQTQNALEWLNGTPDFSGDAVDAYVVSSVAHSGTPQLAKPAQLELFRLPAGAARISLAHPNRADSDPAISVKDAASWSTGTPGVPAPVMLNVWRQWRGTNAAQLSDVNDLSAYVDLDKIVPSAPPSNPAQLPPGWPAAPIHFIDAGSGGTGLDVGHWSYRLNAIDHFGRWSPISDPVPWTIVPASSPATALAVHLEDRIAPPPPAGVQASVLDDADRYLVRDAAYSAWKESFGTNPPPAGLRVSWRWPWSHRNQGPDLREFRIYLQSRPLNARTGRVTAVAAVAGNPGRSAVTLELDTPDPLGPNAAYPGASLHAGDRSFAIVASQGTNVLQVTVQNGGPLGNERPESGVDGAVVVPEGHPLHKKVLDPRNWRDGWIAAVPESIAGTRYDVELVQDATTNAGLQGSAATLNAATQVLSLNENVDLTSVVAGRDLVYLATSGATPADPQYFKLILAVDPAAHTLTLPPVPVSGPVLVGPPPATTLSAQRRAAPANVGLTWKIGSPVRYYDVFLPNPAVPAIETPPNLSIATMLAPTLEHPIAYGAAAVSSADWRDEIDDLLAPQRNRKGNESFLAAPATVFRVRRDPPAAPAYAYGAPRLYATKADVRGRSFRTVRWNKPPLGPLFAHVFRALDRSVLWAHWNLDVPLAVSPTGAPAGLAAALTSFAALKNQHDYAGATSLYDTLDDAVLAWLAACSELSSAYMQITIEPLDLSDPSNQDRVGPDDVPAYVPNPSVCAYVDALDGRSANRYFYAVMLLDKAQNRGPLGAPTPPVYLPKVVPPTAPVLTKVTGDENAVLLRWLLSRDPRVKAYRIYRSDTAAKADDIRGMDPIVQLAVQNLQPSPQYEVSWTDAAAPVGAESFYRVTAIDGEAPPNESLPSKVAAARAVDTTPPSQPAVSAAWIAVGAGKAPQIVVSTAAARCELFRRTGDETLWQPVTAQPQDAPGTKTFVDRDAPLGKPLAYQAVARNRARVASAAGVFTLGPG